MSMTMEDDIKRWTAKPKAALVGLADKRVRTKYDNQASINPNEWRN